MTAAAPAGGGGCSKEGGGESSSPRGPAPAPDVSGGSGRGGGVGGGLRDVFREVFGRLVADGHAEAAGALGPELPTSYQLDVNIDNAKDVLIHQRVLEEAKDSDKCPASAKPFLRIEEAKGDKTTNSDAHEEGADTGEALSTRSMPSYTNSHEIVFSTTGGTCSRI